MTARNTWKAFERQIASDLHDGVVQDLAGVAYSLSAATRTGNGAGPDPALIDQSAEAVRSSIRALRSLVGCPLPVVCQSAQGSTWGGAFRLARSWL